MANPSLRVGSAVADTAFDFRQMKVLRIKWAQCRAVLKP
jgi:hypothetical protein